MVDSALATNSPNGSVGVSGWARNADLMYSTPGVVFGFGCNTSGMTVQPVMSGYNVCIAVNANRDRDVFSRNGSDSSVKLTLSTPPTPNQGRCYAIVAYKLASEKATQNNGVGTIHYIAVPGPDTTQGNENPPTDSAIRSAISGGSTAYICVTTTVTVYYGDTTIDSSKINSRLPYTTTPINGSTIPGYQLQSYPNLYPVVVEQSINKTDNVWDYVKWSNGVLEIMGNITVSGSFKFDTSSGWNTVSLQITKAYPIQLKATGANIVATRVANLISSDNGYVCPTYTAGRPKADQFGELRMLDPHGGTINNPVFSIYVRGYWY